MMLSRPLIDSKSAREIDVPFRMCEYHWKILNSAFNRYLISLDEAASQARYIANGCPECESSPL